MCYTDTRAVSNHSISNSLSSNYYVSSLITSRLAVNTDGSLSSVANSDTTDVEAQW